MNIDKIEKGEIVYCNMEIQYERQNTKFNRSFNKKMYQAIFCRPYDCDSFPILDVVKYKLLINKMDRKNSYYISKAKIINLDVITRAGFKNK